MRKRLFQEQAIPKGLSSSASAASCHARDRSTAASKAGPSPSSTARRRFFAWVRCLSANSRCEASILSDAVASYSSATGLSAHGISAAVSAMTCASIPSVLATSGDMSPAPFIARPGK